MLAPRPLATERPAGSSAPVLIFRPVESSVRVFCRLDCVVETAFSATSEEMLFNRVMLMFALLLISISACTEPVLFEVQNRYLEQVVFVLRAIYRRLVLGF